MNNLLAYIPLFSLAIAIIPREKLYIAAIGALPFSVFIASSLLADALLIGLCAIFFALFSAITTHCKQISETKLLLLTILTIMLLTCKIAYARLVIFVLDSARRSLFAKRRYLCCGLSARTAISVYNYMGSHIGLQQH